MANQKIFKTLDEQIEILENKGLIINDIEKTKDIILRENYFFIMGYRHLFLKEDHSKQFKNGTTFEELYALFVFDRMFRNIIFKNILIVENNYKSILSYTLSKKYGYKEKDYLNPKNFDEDKARSRQINDLIRKVKRQYRVNGLQHGATIHYIENYGYIPFWIGIKVISFGLISEMFSVLKPIDKKEVADVYHIEPDEMQVYLPILANYRNLCAHEDILYENKTQKEKVNIDYLLNIFIILSRRPSSSCISVLSNFCNYSLTNSISFAFPAIWIYFS